MAWNCPVCGFSEKGAQAPANCPVCGTSGERFTSAEISESHAAPVAEKAADKPQEGQTAQRWKCPVCGYIHTGPAPPEKCPVCGSPRSVFVEITPQAEPQATEEPTAAKVPTAGGGDRAAAASPWRQRFDLLRDKMVELHAHPIAVHIPNGLLPIAVLFLLLSMLLGSNSLATASFYNLIVVTLAMPVVLFSGYNDWQKRFGGNMTPVFMTKMVCGAVIAAGSFILVVWRLVSPGVATAGGSGRWAYLFVHLVLLAAAGMAGYQGGKLVIFPDGSSDR